MTTSLITRNIISTVIYRQTGIEINPSQIDMITAHNIATAVISFDGELIDRAKFDRVVIFNVNIILDREGFKMFFVPPATSRKYTRIKLNLNYN